MFENRKKFWTCARVTIISCKCPEVYLFYKVLRKVILESLKGVSLFNDIGIKIGREVVVPRTPRTYRITKS